LADPQPAGDIAHGDVGDGGVEHFHERHEGHQDGDQPRIGRAARCTLGNVLRDLALGSGAHRRALSRSRSEGAGSTRTLGTTDMPGPTATSLGGLSIVIFTGTRWTILTKLPVAFSAGSSENAVPDPGWTLATWP